MRADAAQDVAEPGFGLEAVELGGADQRVHDGGALAARVAAREQPVLAAECDRPDRILGGVV